MHNLAKGALGGGAQGYYMKQFAVRQEPQTPFMGV